MPGMSLLLSQGSGKPQPEPGMLPAVWPPRANPAQFLVSFAEPVLPEAQLWAELIVHPSREPLKDSSPSFWPRWRQIHVVWEGSASAL